jgi:UDPglucose 6-dehydrogenase
MRIAVVGSGYVGLVTGTCFAELGHDVLLVDNDEKKLAELRTGQVPIHERYLPELLDRHRGDASVFRAKCKRRLAIATRSSSRWGRLPPIAGTLTCRTSNRWREIAGAVDSYKVVVEKSTVPVYTSQWIRTVIIRNGANPASFDIASNPEFLREGTAVGDFLYPDRIVVGAEGERCANVLREIYAPLASGEYYSRADAIPPTDRARTAPRLIVTSTRSAELIKHASNAFLAMKISFINAVASICEAVGADVQQVCDGVGADSRIGPRFLNPGIGYGGSCFPKDLMAFHSVAKECGYDFGLLDEVIRSRAAPMTSASRQLCCWCRNSCARAATSAPTIPPPWIAPEKYCRPRLSLRPVPTMPPEGLTPCSS